MSTESRLESALLRIGQLHRRRQFYRGLSTACFYAIFISLLIGVWFQGWLLAWAGAASFFLLSVGAALMGEVYTARMNGTIEGYERAERFIGELEGK